VGILGDNLVSNGGFDSNTTGWSSYEATLASTAGGQAGNYSKVTKLVANQNGTIQRNITALITEGVSYKITYYAQKGTAPSVNVGISTLYYAAPNIYSESNTDTNWNTKHSFTFVAPAGTVYFVAQPLSSTIGHYSMIDTVSLHEVNSGNLIAGGLLTGGGANGIKILDDGNVGIGTTAPTAPLQVHTSINGEALRLSQVDDANTDVGPSLTFYNGVNHQHLASIKGAFNAANGNYANLIFSTRTTDALGVQEKMRILHNGNVGIGTASPRAKLDVAGGEIAFDTTGTLGRCTALGMCAGVVGSQSYGYGQMAVIKNNGVSCDSTCDLLDGDLVNPYTNYFCYGGVTPAVSHVDVGQGVAAASGWFGVNYCSSTNGMGQYCCCKANASNTK